jgi:hypothetical protein
VESSRATILSKIIRLRLTYDGEALGSPSTVILKTGHPDRLGDANWDAGRQEVAFYNEVAAVKPGHHLLRCYEAPPLLDRYHAALLASGVQGYDRAVLAEDYRLAVLWQTTTPIWQATSNIPPLIWWNNLERIFLAVDDLNCQELLD